MRNQPEQDPVLRCGERTMGRRLCGIVTIQPTERPLQEVIEWVRAAVLTRCCRGDILGVLIERDFPLDPVYWPIQWR